MTDKHFLLAEISWEECAEYLTRDDRVILPIGATEQHGRHLGLGTDYMIAEDIARRVGQQSGVLVAPTLCYGMSHAHMEFAGTVSLSPVTLTAVLQDIMGSLHKHGFRRILVVNGHGGNHASVQSATTMLQGQFPDLKVKIAMWWAEPELLRLVDHALGTQQGTHASNHETAFMHAVAPQAVHSERIAKRDAPVVPSKALDSSTQFRDKYPDGVMGLDPTPADAVLGERILGHAVKAGVAEVETW